MLPKIKLANLKSHTNPKIAPDAPIEGALQNQ